MGLRFFARKVSVEADSIKEKPGKYHQTGTHNAKKYAASGKVVVTVKDQYIDRSHNPSRPVPGSVFRGDSALVSAREKDHIHPLKDDPSRMEGSFKKNVIVDISGSDSVSKKGRGRSR